MGARNIIEYILVSLVTAAGGGALLLVTFIQFWGKTFVEKNINTIMKEKQHKLDAELDKLRSANALMKDILLSLYDEKRQAYKEIASTMYKLSKDLRVTLSNLTKPKQIILYDDIDGILESFNDLLDAFADAYMKNAIFIENDLFESLDSINNDFECLVKSLIDNLTPQNVTNIKSLLPKSKCIDIRVRDVASKMKTSLLRKSEIEMSG